MQPVNLPADIGQPEGATNYWETYCCPGKCDPPTLDDVIKALSSADPVTSWAARNFYEVFINQNDFPIVAAVIDALKKSGATMEALRLAIAMSAIHVRAELTDYPEARDLLRQSADSGFINKDKGVLSLLGELELYRLDRRNGKAPLDGLLSSLPDRTSLDEVTFQDLWRATRQISKKGFKWKADEETGRKIRNWLLGPGATQKELEEPVSTELQFIPR